IAPAHGLKLARPISCLTTAGAHPRRNAMAQDGQNGSGNVRPDESVEFDAGSVTGAVANLDAAAEDAYWRDHFRKRPYADETLSYDHYRPAYRYGWESRARLSGRRWDEVERELERGWRENRGASRLGWADAKLAARDAWQRIDHRIA